jgi:hypothetical protein
LVSAKEHDYAGLLDSILISALEGLPEEKNQTLVFYYSVKPLIAHP